VLTRLLGGALWCEAGRSSSESLLPWFSTLILPPRLQVTVLYDDLDPNAKIKNLPLELRVAEDENLDSAAIVSVNGTPIEPLAIVLTGSPGLGVHRGTVDFKKLSKTFVLGMNRFEVKADDDVTEVLLEIEF